MWIGGFSNNYVITRRREHLEVISCTPYSNGLIPPLTSILRTLDNVSVLKKAPLRPFCYGFVSVGVDKNAGTLTFIPYWVLDEANIYKPVPTRKSNCKD